MAIAVESPGATRRSPSKAFAEHGAASAVDTFLGSGLCRGKARVDALHTPE